MSTSEEVKRMITLKSNDGETFEVLPEAAAMSVTLKQMMEDDVGNEIPLPLVSGKALAKIIEFCNKHSVNSSDEDDEKVNDDLKAKDWDKEFINMDFDKLTEIMQAANYLNIKSLLDLSCQAVADTIKGLSPEEVRKKFNIVNDFTPEEEEALRKEHAWAFES